jgi:hypothetical protein
MWKRGFALLIGRVVVGHAVWVSSVPFMSRDWDWRCGMSVNICKGALHVKLLCVQPQLATSIQQSAQIFRHWKSAETLPNSATDLLHTTSTAGNPCTQKAILQPPALHPVGNG